MGELNNRSINGLPLCNEKPSHGAPRVGCQDASASCTVLPAAILNVPPCPRPFYPPSLRRPLTAARLH